MVTYINIFLLAKAPVVYILQERLTSQHWWLMPLIPALGRQRQVDFRVQGQPVLQSKLKDSQGDTEKSCLKKTKERKEKKRKRKAD